MVFALHCLVKAGIKSEDGWVLVFFRQNGVVPFRFLLALLQQIAMTDLSGNL